jgi:hypothetical protein
MTELRRSARDLSGLKKSPGLRALRGDQANPVEGESSVEAPQDLAPPESCDEGGLSEPRTRPAVRGKARQRAPADLPASAKRGTIAYVPAELKARLEEAARRAQQTYTEWFLDQFDSLYDELGEEFAPPQQRRSPLPVRARARRRRVGLGPSTMVQLRLTGEELAAIDERREQLGAPSRSEFVTRIIELGVERSR